MGEPQHIKALFARERIGQRLAVSCIDADVFDRIFRFEQFGLAAERLLLVADQRLLDVVVTVHADDLFGDVVGVLDVVAEKRRVDGEHAVLYRRRKPQPRQDVQDVLFGDDDAENVGDLGQGHAHLVALGRICERVDDALCDLAVAVFVDQRQRAHQAEALAVRVDASLVTERRIAAKIELA